MTTVRWPVRRRKDDIRVPFVCVRVCVVSRESCRHRFWSRDNVVAEPGLEPESVDFTSFRVLVVVANATGHLGALRFSVTHIAWP